MGAGPKAPERLDIGWWLVAGSVSDLWTERSELRECCEPLTGIPECDKCDPCAVTPGGWAVMEAMELGFECWLSRVPRRSTRFIFLRHLKKNGGSFHEALGQPVEKGD